MSKKLMRKKLAMMLATLKKKRKFFCEVEYLESTGTQYIDTGITGTTTTMGVDVEWMFSDDSENMCIFSSRSGQTSNTFTLFWLKTSQNRMRFDANGQKYFASGVNTVPDQLMRFTYKSASGAVATLYNLTNGTSQTETIGQIPTVSSNNLYLFQSRDNGSVTSSIKMYYFKLYDGDTLLRDMIPVLDWNYVPCMYDKVSDQLFYNAGTGNFTAGREIHYVDYLESTGVEYIDTGIKFDGANTKIELKTYENDLTRRHSICGDDGNIFYYFRGTGNWAVGYNATAFNIDSYMSVGDNVFIMDKNNVYVNGVLAKTYTLSGNISSYNALLFNRKTSLVDNGAVTIYYCKIWNNNVLVRDYIPAIDENGIAYLFDRVSHTCFLNQGTGAFKYPAREVEYLQSDGARAIVAGVTVDDTCGYDVKWMALNSNDRIIMGTKGSGDSRWVLSGGNNPNVNISWNTSSGGVGLGLNKIQTAQMNYFNDRKRILNDTPLTDITQTLSANASTYSVGIFGGYWGASSISLYSTCRIYYAKITKGTELIRNFIPMVKDGSPCLFDKIGGLYYFGTGTGTFTTGRILEEEYE